MSWKKPALEDGVRENERPEQLPEKASHSGTWRVIDASTTKSWIGQFGIVDATYLIQNAQGLGVLHRSLSRVINPSKRYGNPYNTVNHNKSLVDPQTKNNNYWMEGFWS